MPAGTIVAADEQTEGRGRGTNKWVSPIGGLWFSILVRPNIPIARLILLQFLAANAAREALEKETGIKVQLKWPNDLVTEKGKLGGILVESKTLGNRLIFAIAGIGVNVNLKADQIPLGGVSVMMETGRTFSLQPIVKAVAKQMSLRIDGSLEPSQILEEWWLHCIHANRRIKITTQSQILIGTNKGIDNEGSLILETEGLRSQKVSEGTLSLLENQ